MPILAYTGRPGAGKSYGVLENVILPSLAKGRQVVTNLPLNLREILKQYPDALITPFDDKDVEQGILDLENNQELRGAIFVIDECWRYWPYGQRFTQVPAHQQSFFTEHRHYVGSDGFSTEVVLVVQSLAQITPAVRELIDTTYIMSKLDKVGQENKYRVDIYSGPQQLTRPDRNQLVRQGFGRYLPAIYKYYRSHTKNDTDFAVGLEKRADDRGNLFTGLMAKVGAPIVLVVGLFGAWGMWQWFDTERFHDKDSATPGPGVVRSSGVPAQRGRSQIGNYHPVVDAPEISDRWRIAAVLWGESENNAGQGFVVLIDAAGRERVLPFFGSRCSKTPGTPADWQCIIDGELVTYYSGQSTRDLRRSTADFKLKL